MKTSTLASAMPSPRIGRWLGITFLLLIVVIANGQTYNAPYEIPRFQDFMSGCKLQAPNSGTAATQSEIINGYTDNNFYVAEGDKVAFNQRGASKRTELRHLTNWDLTQGDRSLHGRIKVVQQTCDQVTLMQIHDDANAGSGPNKPLLRIYKHQTKNPVNHLWAAIKTDAGGQNTTHVDLGLAPTGYFNCDIKLVGGNMIIDVDGVEKVNMNVSYWDWPSYWKAGVYLQDNGEATAYFDELYLGNGGGTGGNNAPSVSITSPTNGASFNDGDNVTITADASDSDGTVSQVEFFVDGASIGVDTSSPYSTNWTIGVGSYDLTAVATDNESSSTTSSTVSITGNNTGPASDAYVSSIVTGTQSAGKGQKHGTATVTILDNNGNPVSNATVTGTFSGTFSETISGSTNSSGTVELVTVGTKKGGVSVDLCVDNVTHGTLAYNAGLNVITCTGSGARISGSGGVPTLQEGKEMGISIYPNPMKSKIEIDLRIDQESRFSAKVFSLDGKVLLRLAPNLLQSGQHKIDLNVNALESGIYLLETKLNGEKRTSRLVKE